MLTTRNKMKLPFLPYLAALTVVISTAEAKLELPRVFGDDMVVQRDKPVQVWGWADKGAQVAVEFSGQSKKTTADDSGKWLLALDASPHGQTFHGCHACKCQAAGTDSENRH